MKAKRRWPSPTMIIACLALFVSLTGTGIAASHYVITSKKQIKPSVLKQLKGLKGAKGNTGARGATGASGATGATGSTGAQGSSGVVTTATLSGFSASIIGGASSYVFCDKVAGVTTTASQRLTGIAAAQLGSSSSAGGQLFGYDLCYQASTGGTIHNFAGSSGSVSAVYPEIRTFTAAGSVVPGAGTWNVGFCVENWAGNQINNNNVVNGWVQVTN